MLQAILWFLLGFVCSIYAWPWIRRKLNGDLPESIFLLTKSKAVRLGGPIGSISSFADRSAKWLTICTVAVSGFEGCYTVAYKDPVGIPTVCFGHTQGVKMTDIYTVAGCEGLLNIDLIQTDQDAQKCVKVPISETRRAAIDSFAFNVGISAFCSSTFLKEINANSPGACNELLRWVYAHKGPIRIKLPGLVRCREQERKLCLA